MHSVEQSNTWFVTPILPIVTHLNFEINVYFSLTRGINIIESHKHDTLQNHTNHKFQLS